LGTRTLRAGAFSKLRIDLTSNRRAQAAMAEGRQFQIPTRPDSFTTPGV
jgi:hypothetical protein